MEAALHREFVYLWYYFFVQLDQILDFWLLGMLIGSAVSVFGKERIRRLFRGLSQSRAGLFGLVPACLLGIASPLCMYGTIPIAASFAAKGMREDWLAAFMTASILLNPQLIIYSAALGEDALAVRVLSCFLCGIAAGLLVYAFYTRKGRPFFRFGSFGGPEDHDTDPNLFLRYVKNVGRNVRATGGWFFMGILLSALFQRYIPAEAFAELFGPGNEGFGVLLAATVGVPLYVCGGGTIPLLQTWLAGGHEPGQRGGLHDHRPGDEDHQSLRPQDLPRRAPLRGVPGVHPQFFPAHGTSRQCSAIKNAFPL